MSRFLRFSVEETLEGRGHQLKESAIGHAVFDRAADYDSRLDPIVRVEARRLRTKLEQYYTRQGSRDGLCIDLPRGAYTPVFRYRSAEVAEPAVAVTGVKTIAVLPFSNLSPEQENAYFSDGLTQELIHVLTKLPGLQVLAWTSSAALRDRTQEPGELSRRFKIDAVLEGAVRRSGNRARITAQLVDARSGLYLWSETYERQVHDLLALQEEVARSIAAVLKIRSTGAEFALPASGGNADAYSLYLRGRYEWNRRTEEGLRQSVAFFERAIQADPNCALAFAGLSDAYSLLCDYGLEPAGKTIQQARAAALRALQIDATLAEALVSLAMVESLHDWNWGEAERHYQRAIALNPGYATARHWYGCDLLLLCGRFDEAKREVAVARQLNPLSANIHESENYTFMLARDHGEAERRYRQQLIETPDFHKAYTGLGRNLACQGRYAEAVEMLRKGSSLVGESPGIVGALAQVHGMWGKRSEAERLLATLYDMARRRHVSGVPLALAHLGLGQKDEALAHLERCFQDRELPLASAGVHPAYDDLRSEPRLRELLKKMDLLS